MANNIGVAVDTQIQDQTFSTGILVLDLVSDNISLGKKSIELRRRRTRIDDQ
jgi:hypothetical protein